MELEPGEVICDKCKGRGTIPKVVKPAGEIVTDIICRKCHGAGKLDWIELCMKKPVQLSFTSITLPIIRHIYPKLIAKDLISVQPIDWVKK